MQISDNEIKKILGSRNIVVRSSKSTIIGSRQTIKN